MRENKSLQSLKQINKQGMEEYTGENPEKSYTSNFRGFYKRESRSNSSSRAKIVPWRTPNAMAAPTAASSNSIILNNQPRKWTNTIKNSEKMISKNAHVVPGKTSMLIDFWSLYLNKDQICLNNKKYNKDLFSHLPNLGNKEVFGKYALPQNKNKLKITFNKQHSVAQKYLNASARRKSNNLTKLHEFENKLLFKEVKNNCVVSKVRLDLRANPFLGAHLRAGVRSSRREKRKQRLYKAQG